MELDTLSYYLLLSLCMDLIFHQHLEVEGQYPVKMYSHIRLNVCWLDYVGIVIREERDLIKRYPHPVALSHCSFSKFYAKQTSN